VKTDLEPGMMKPKAKPLPLLRHSFYKIKEYVLRGYLNSKDAAFIRRETLWD
jgi:hypothetical protein